MLLGFVPCFPEGFKFRGSGHLLGPEEFGGPKGWYSYLKPFILYARWYDSFPSQQCTPHPPHFRYCSSRCRRATALWTSRSESSLADTEFLTQLLNLSECPLAWSVCRCCHLPIEPGACSIGSWEVKFIAGYRDVSDD